MAFLSLTPSSVGLLSAPPFLAKASVEPSLILDILTQANIHADSACRSMRPWLEPLGCASLGGLVLCCLGMVRVKGACVPMGWEALVFICLEHYLKGRR